MSLAPFPSSPCIILHREMSLMLLLLYRLPTSVAGDTFGLPFWWFRPTIGEPKDGSTHLLRRLPRTLQLSGIADLIGCVIALHHQLCPSPSPSYQPHLHKLHMRGHFRDHCWIYILLLSNISPFCTIYRFCLICCVLLCLPSELDWDLGPCSVRLCSACCADDPFGLGTLYWWRLWLRTLLNISVTLLVIHYCFACTY